MRLVVRCPQQDLVAAGKGDSGWGGAAGVVELAVLVGPRATVGDAQAFCAAETGLQAGQCQLLLEGRALGPASAPLLGGGSSSSSGDGDGGDGGSSPDDDNDDASDSGGGGGGGAAYSLQAEVALTLRPLLLDPVRVHVRGPNPPGGLTHAVAVEASARLSAVAQLLRMRGLAPQPFAASSSSSSLAASAGSSSSERAEAAAVSAAAAAGGGGAGHKDDGGCCCSMMVVVNRADGSCAPRVRVAGGDAGGAGAANVQQLRDAIAAAEMSRPQTLTFHQSQLGVLVATFSVGDGEPGAEGPPASGGWGRSARPQPAMPVKRPGGSLVPLAALADELAL